MDSAIKFARDKITDPVDHRAVMIPYFGKFVPKPKLTNGDVVKFNKSKVTDMYTIEQIVLAHRYLYYVKNTPIISDYEYDLLEKKALLSCDNESPLHNPGSDLIQSYSTNTIELAEKLVNGDVNKFNYGK